MHMVVLIVMSILAHMALVHSPLVVAVVVAAAVAEDRKLYKFGHKKLI